MTPFHDRQDRHERRDSLIAALLTMLATALILVVLFTCGMNYEKRELAEASTPELMPDEEELFYEPELIEAGEEMAVVNDAPSPDLKGEPEKSTEENREVVVKGTNPKPAPPVEKLVTQKKESPVKATEPSETDKEIKKATSEVAGKFASRNGNADAKASGAGAGGEGVGVTGNMRGRTFLGCPKPVVALRHKTVVTVNVVVDSEGRVISASATGSADASIRRKCEQAARQARWSAKKGAPETHGSITFTITPK